MIKTSKTIHLLKGECIDLYIPFLQKQEKEGSQPAPIDTQLLDDVFFHISKAGETGVKTYSILEVQGGKISNLYCEYAETELNVYEDTEVYFFNNGINTLRITGSYGGQKFENTLVIVCSGHTEEPHDITEVHTPDCVFEYICEGGGGDYKTDVYMDGDGRVMVERLGNGATMILDEHENPIIKRQHNGTTEYFDAYQRHVQTISPDGKITTYNANGGVLSETYPDGIVYYDGSGNIIGGTRCLTFGAELHGAEGLTISQFATEFGITEQQANDLKDGLYFSVKADVNLLILSYRGGSAGSPNYIFGYADNTLGQGVSVFIGYAAFSGVFNVAIHEI